MMRAASIMKAACAFPCFLHSTLARVQPCPRGCPSNPSPPVSAPKGAKNVLFFAVDDLRPEMEVFGGVPGTPVPKMHTPNLNALAAKSLVLKKNYVQQAVCSPTRQSLLTSRRPDRTRVYDLWANFRSVAGNYTTLPEWFKMHGYNTIGMGKIFHPGHASGADSHGTGGDDLCCSWSNDSFYFHAPNLQYWQSKVAGGNGGKSWMSVDPATEATHPLPDQQIAVQATATLRQLGAQRDAGDPRPFFLAVGFHKPHLPFVASSKYFKYYPPSSVELPPDQQPPKGMPPIAWSPYGELRGYSDQKTLNASGAPGTVLPSQDVLALRRAYYAAVTQTDDMVGRVLKTLEEIGEANNTVVSLFGDHGWQLGEHGEWCKHTNFEFATRAPMMIHVPALTDTGIVTEQYSEHVDLFPTLTEVAAGIVLETCPPGEESFSVPLCTEGSSLVPLMRNPSVPFKLASFSQYPRSYVKAGPPSVDEVQIQSEESPCIRPDGKCTMGYTLVTEIEGYEYRYTEWADFNTPGHKLKVNWGRIVGVELYNHSADSGENFNINATEGSARVRALSQKLSERLRAGPDAARMLTVSSLVV